MSEKNKNNNGASMKKLFSSKQFTYGSTTFVMTAAVVGILLLINIFIGSMPWKLDLTTDKLFTLSDETVEYLKKIDKDVTIYAVYNLGGEPEDVKNTLEEYKKYTPGLKVQYVDPDKDIAVARKFVKADETLSSGTIVVESGSRFRKLREYDLYDYDYQTQTLKASKVEQKLTGAISYVVSDKDPVIYILGGHREMGLESSSLIKGTIEDMNYEIKDLNLTTEGAVPEDADIVAIIAPKNDISIDERVKLDKYMDNGGRMMVFLEPYTELPNLAETLQKYNIGIDNDIVIETDASSVMFSYPLYLKPRLLDTDITSSIARKNLNIIFPEARSLNVIRNEKLGLTVTPLARTSDASWGETDFSNSNPKKDSNDITGPLDVAIAAEKEASTVGVRQSRMLVFGDSTFLTDEAFQRLGADGNYDLFSNSLNWLGEREDTVIVRSKYITSEVLQINSISQVTFILILVALLPILAIIAGTVIWFRRRHL